VDWTPALLVTTIFLPVAGAILAGGLGAMPSRALGGMPSRGEAAGRHGCPRKVQRIRQSALVTTLFVLGMTTVLAVTFPGGAEPFAAFDFPWLGSADAPVDIRFSLALDGLSLWLFALTALLTVVAVLVSWEAIGERAAAFYGVLLLLETGMLGVFAARDIILFFLFFEFTLVPLFFLIGVWGSEERRHAAIKFFLFTMAGSVLTFLGLIAVVLWDYYHSPSGQMTFSIPQLTADLAARPMPWPLQLAVFLALFAGFAIKVPLVPLHTWLPLAHVQAPTAGSVVLAGVLLKIGAYGFVRFALPMTPDAVVFCTPWLLWLAVAGIVYGALVALAQQDIKRLIAYSSVSHLGFCMLGVFALNRLGLEGGVLQLVNHGLATGGLFAVVGMLYERFHTRQIDDFGGLARQLPRLATLMVILTLSSIGLPGLNGFVGEFLLLLGMFQRAWTDAPAMLAGQFRVIAVLAVSGVVLGAWYMLQLVQRVFFGPLRIPLQQSHPEGHPPPGDLSLRETFALGLLVVFIFWIGLQPRVFLDRMSPTLEKIITPVEQSYARQYSASSVSSVVNSFSHHGGHEGTQRDAAWTEDSLSSAGGPRRAR
jgi:NADH-quinone oxidoreductase subunit M